MIIGTLSFEIQGEGSHKCMTLQAAERRDIIAHVAEAYHPYLLLCAGFSLGKGCGEGPIGEPDNAELNVLVNDPRIFNGTTTLIVEVKNEPEAMALLNGLSAHRIYLVGCHGHVRSLGRQAIKRGNDWQSGQDRKQNDHIAHFEDLISEKSALIGKHQLFTLCCGEINALKAHPIKDNGQRGHEIEFCCPGAEKALGSASIIVNPTHDWMRDTYGTLSAKRRRLSRPDSGLTRIYVSASNWNSTANQQPHYETLHSVYLSGQKCHPVRCHPAAKERKERYEYRECEVPI